MAKDSYIITEEGEGFSGGKKRSRRMRTLILNLIFVLVCVGVAFAVSNYMFISVPVKGYSMLETLQDGDRMLLYRIGNYRRGDVVVFDSEDPSSGAPERYVKRIIGLPGDTVEIIRSAEGNLVTYVNAEPLTEDYITHAGGQELARYTVKEGEFFYMGDNRKNSYDSRNGGAVGRLDDILGRVLLRYRLQGEFTMQGVKRVKYA